MIVYHCRCALPMQLCVRGHELSVAPNRRLHVAVQVVQRRNQLPVLQMPVLAAIIEVNGAAGKSRWS